MNHYPGLIWFIMYIISTLCLYVLQDSLQDTGQGSDSGGEEDKETEKDKYPEKRG